MALTQKYVLQSKQGEAYPKADLPAQRECEHHANNQTQHEAKRELKPGKLKNRVTGMLRERFHLLWKVIKINFEDNNTSMV